MNIVVLDGNVLGNKAEFPPLEADKYGWQQYPQLEGDDITERCWRSDIVVSLATPLRDADLEKMAKLKLVITGGPMADFIDRDKAAEQEIQVREFTEFDWNDGPSAQCGCDAMVRAIDEYLQGGA